MTCVSEVLLPDFLHEGRGITATVGIEKKQNRHGLDNVDWAPDLDGRNSVHYVSKLDSFSRQNGTRMYRNLLSVTGSSLPISLANI